MAIATGTAIALAAGVGAGASLGGAALQSRAAGKAAKQQQQAIGQALPYLQQQAAQGRADLAPYAAMGGSALTPLSALAGLPRAAAPPPVTGVGGAGPSMYGAGGAPGGAGLVILRAPTGQLKQVPADQAEFYMARGAQRV